MSEAMVVTEGLVKGYRTAAGYVPVLRQLDVEVPRGEMLAVTGASGVGKSTLLHVLGTLDRPESGTIRVAGEDVLTLPEDRLRQFRNRTLGFVFQAHHLLPEFDALENVMMPGLIARRPVPEVEQGGRQLLGELGLSERLHHRPGALSGGEQQRVAIARALAMSPRLLLADEPTGNLDEETGATLVSLLRRLNAEKGITVVIVTHSPRIAAACDRVLRLEGGRLNAP
jgi:lipoprotein-releasing system ATP-binding protein